MAHPVFVKLDEREFANLVKGRVVEVDGRCGPDIVPVRVILADIGFARMLSWIDRAINDQDRHSG
jgi:NOL1/NOP2/fmu family ribosome biogenesis protein